ncbi:hypothetical protein EB796_001667 [Bugula neritina]|uniref:Uncharacterized protein n=1 Tax=Bugula neritina TaxID=10212 RepID=A0A7J7KP65_BUGNE|nr:hypothetical protein EB796_001667 [Bugula neritina]
MVSKKKSKEERSENPERHVNMQTERTVNGQNMTQVIVKQNPHSTLDKYNRNDIPYQTMDPETNTVRYDTGNQSMASPQDPSEITVTFRDANGSQRQVIRTQPDEGKSEAVEPQTEVDAAADVHIEDLTTGHTNEAFQDDAEIMPDSVTYKPTGHYYDGVAQYEEAPPPLLPGTPVTDLDAPSEPSTPPSAPPTPPPIIRPHFDTLETDQRSPTPPPAPPPAPTPPLPERSPTPPTEIDYTYATLSKTRGSQKQGAEEAGSSDLNASMSRSVWRPSNEIEIIEKAKF